MVILCLLCAACIGLTIRFSAKRSSSDDFHGETGSLEDGRMISKGDSVTVSVYASEMDSVYGYQFYVYYDTEILEYQNRLYSEIDDIPTIFATNKDQCLLVGATMTGKASGFNGRDVFVCRIEFVALEDTDLEQIMLSRVNIVTEDMQYLENIDGWTVSVTVP